MGGRSSVPTNCSFQPPSLPPLAGTKNKTFWMWGSSGSLIRVAALGFR